MPEPFSIGTGLAMLGGFFAHYAKFMVEEFANEPGKQAVKKLHKHLEHELKKGELPANHDLRRALEDSLLEAVYAFALGVGKKLGPKLPFIDAIKPHLEQGTFSDTPLLALRHVNGSDWVKELLAAARQARDTHQPVSGSGGISADLILDEGRVTQLLLDDNYEDLQRLVHKSFEQWLERHVQHAERPECVNGFLDHGWPVKDDPDERLTFYQAFCLFFREKVKHRTEVFNILVAGTLSQVARDQKALADLPKQVAEILQRLGAKPPSAEDFDQFLTDRLNGLEQRLGLQIQAVHVDVKAGLLIGQETLTEVLAISAKLGALPTGTHPWHPPRAADQFFGRAQEILDVAALLRRHHRVALIGPGGMGKTALAAEAITVLAPARDEPGLFSGGIYSHDYYQSPGHPAALSSILAQAKLELTPDRDRPAVVKRLLDEPGVLLYLEGCEKAEQLFELLNLSVQVKVLVTTRDSDKSGGAHPHEVRGLDPESAAGLLAYHADQKELAADPTVRKPWLDLAVRLGRHPLGLSLAGAWLRRRKQTPAKFLDQLTRGGLAFWDTNLEPKENLRVLFQHSAEAAHAKHPESLTAWFALALHAHGPVPISALCGALACDEDEAELRLGALQDYSLAEPTELPGATEGQFERAWQLTHALLGEWGREALRRRRREESHLSPSTQPEPTAGIDGDSLRRHLRDDGQPIRTAWLVWWKQDLRNVRAARCVPGGPVRYQALQPHWAALLENLQVIEGEDSQRLPFFLNLIALSHQWMGNYSAAEPLIRRALECDKRVLGPEHQETLTSVNNLALLLKAKGDLAGAEPLYRRGLEVRERVLGPEHPDTLTSVNNLAALLDSKGDLAGAEPLYRRALAVCERVLGPEHPDTLSSVNNLASLLYAKGDLAEAEPLLRRALEVSERVLGLEHPNTLTIVNNLAGLLQAKGDLAGAEPLLRRGLEVCERVLGPKHPDTLTIVNNLAGLLQAKGDLAGAEPLLRRGLEVREHVLGPKHPDTLGSVNNLARLLHDKGDLAGAEPLLRRGLEVRESVLGPEHPDTLISVNNLASLLYAKGDLAGAEPLLRRGLEVSERVLGPEHPSTLISVNNLARLLHDKGDLAGALPLFERAVRGLRAKLGPEHPNTKTGEQNLASLRRQLAEQKPGQ